MTREEIVAEARSWIGTPWVHQGRIKGLSVDCVGLIGGVALAVGIQGARDWSANLQFYNYGRQPDPLLLNDGCALWLDRIAVRDATMADVLVMRFRRDPQHFALLSATDYMIHAFAGAGKVVENRLDEKWRRRIVSAWRFRGID